jgi:hypothetical protein
MVSSFLKLNTGAATASTPRYRVVAGRYRGDAFALYVSEQGVGVVEGVDAGGAACAAGSFA